MKTVLLFVLLAVFFQGCFPSETIYLHPIIDTAPDYEGLALLQDDNEANNTIDDVVIVGDSPVLRTILTYDLSPLQNRVVTRATLHLVNNGYGGLSPEGQRVNINRISAAIEYSDNPGLRTPSWNTRIPPATLWNDPGGDFYPQTFSFLIALDSPTAPVHYVVPITSMAAWHSLDQISILLSLDDETYATEQHFCGKYTCFDGGGTFGTPEGNTSIWYDDGIANNGYDGTAVLRLQIGNASSLSEADTDTVTNWFLRLLNNVGIQDESSRILFAILALVATVLLSIRLKLELVLIGVALISESVFFIFVGVLPLYLLMISLLLISMMIVWRIIGRSGASE